MPAKSKAQVRKMAVLRNRGELTTEQFAHFKPSKAQWKKLPARVKRRTKRKKG